MNRFGFEESEMAKVLMLMSHGQEQAMARHAQLPERVFQCKTCNRTFPSFQALGGHRASHKKPKLAEDGGELSLASKPKLHGCSICGLEFAVGQALGGHMRRHRAVTAAGLAHGLIEKKGAEDEKRGLWLDLNLPPSDDDEDGERRTAGLTFHQFLDSGPMAVDCAGY